MIGSKGILIGVLGLGYYMAMMSSIYGWGLDEPLKRSAVKPSIRSASPSTTSYSSRRRYRRRRSTTWGRSYSTRRRSSWGGGGFRSGK